MDFTQHAQNSLNKLEKIFFTAMITKCLIDYAAGFPDNPNYAETEQDYLSIIDYLEENGRNTFTDFLACEPASKNMFSDQLGEVDVFFEGNSLSGDENFFQRKEILFAILDQAPNENENFSAESASIINETYALNHDPATYNDLSSKLLAFSETYASTIAKDTYLADFYNRDNSTVDLMQLATQKLKSNLDVIYCTPDISTTIITERQAIFNALMAGENNLINTTNSASNTLDDRNRTENIRAIS